MLKHEKCSNTQRRGNLTTFMVLCRFLCCSIECIVLFILSAALTNKNIISTADIQFDTYLADWQAAHSPLSPSDPLPAKQSVWDKPGILSSSASVQSAISDSCQKARFLAAAAPHSGDWLLALPVTSCGLRLTDEAVRVAVALRLGCSVCVTHTCRCGALVDA